MINWNDIKSFNRKELDEITPNGFEFKTKPWVHQLAAFLSVISNGGFLCALDLGTGKTKVSIDTFRFFAFRDKRKDYKILYLCLSTAVGKMRDEVEKHSDFKVVRLDCTKAEKWKRIEDPSYNFYIAGYEGFRSMVTERELKKTVNVFDRKTGKYVNKKSRKEVISIKAIKKFKKLGFDGIIIDESHVLKNSKSLIFRVIKKIIPSIKYKVLLTGTPIGNSLIDIWAQYFIVDNGETYGKSFSIFRDSYFKDTGFFGPIWTPTDLGREFIKGNLYNYAIRYSEEEVEDLPPKVFRTLQYSLSPKQRTEYDKLTEGLYSCLTEEVASKGKAYREICSGFVGGTDYLFNPNPKLNLLWDTISNVIDDHKVVVFFERTPSRKMVEKLLKKKKVKFKTLGGETKDKYEAYNTFQTDPKYRVFLAQIKSGGSSIDLFAATYCIHYEHGGSLINYKQSIKRIHRGGQTKRCFFYTLVGIGTVERSIFRDLSNNNDAFTNVVDGKSAKAYLKGE